MKKVVFLDRDGVICEDSSYLHKPEDLKLIPGSSEAIKKLNESGFLVVVITNQSVVARGMCSEDDLRKIHSHLCNSLKEKGAKLDAIYYCPHHPRIGKNPKYTKECECRKPKKGMILDASKDFSSEIKGNCYLVGDKISDIEAGVLSGCKTILVGSESEDKPNFNEMVPDLIAKDLTEAVDKIMKDTPLTKI